MRSGLGILGLGSFSTTYFIKVLNEVYNNKHGGYSTCPFILLNADFDEINPYLPDQGAAIEEVLSKYLDKLISHGVDHIAIPNITIYQYIDTISRGVDPQVSFVHPFTEVINSLLVAKASTVTLFGSAYTMQKGYVYSSLCKAGIQVTFPSASDRLFIDDFRVKVYGGSHTKDDLIKYVDLIYNYDHVVIACSELSIPLQDVSLDKPIYDMLYLMVQKMVNIS